MNKNGYMGRTYIIRDADDGTLYYEVKIESKTKEEVVNYIYQLKKQWQEQDMDCFLVDYILDELADKYEYFKAKKIKDNLYTEIIDI